MSRALAAAALLALLAAPAARAQTMLDQEQRLIDLHALLVDLPPVEAPGALAPWELALALEVITVPPIDGTTGGKRQLTASDHTPAFPRPRLALGLPAPPGLRAFVGLSYTPPLVLGGVSSHQGALEAGLAWRRGPLSVGVRGHVLYADARGPVTDPATRDALFVSEGGADLAAGWLLRAGPAEVTPYAGLGFAALQGDFRVTSDGVVLRSSYAGLALHGGVRAVLLGSFEAVAELDAFPGRLVHPSFRVAYLLPLGHG
jgi:hypothetical protein